MLLSICIPTYNRAEYLNNTLNSIVVQDRFINTFDVEIVISDNCSSDVTPQIVKKYLEVFPDKIRYFRNEVNIFDRNFEKVLSHGRGAFLKLNNDTLVHKENTLDVIIESIKLNFKRKDILFFSNGSISDIVHIQVHNLDSFVHNASYYITWIGSFGLWKTDFDSIDDFNKNAKLQLVQVDILLRLISIKKHVSIINMVIFEPVNPKQKGGYNLFEVFVRNYLTLLNNYVKTNQLSKSVFKSEKHKLLNGFIFPWYCNILFDKSLTFKTNGANNYLLEFFSITDVIKFRIKVIMYKNKRILKKIIKKIIETTTKIILT